MKSAVSGVNSFGRTDALVGFLNANTVSISVFSVTVQLTELNYSSLIYPRTTIHKSIFLSTLLLKFYTLSILCTRAPLACATRVTNTSCPHSVLGWGKSYLGFQKFRHLFLFAQRQRTN